MPLPRGCSVTIPQVPMLFSEESTSDGGQVPQRSPESLHLETQIISWVVRGLGVSHCSSPHLAEGTLDFPSQLSTQMFCFPPEESSLGKGLGQVLEQLDFGHSHSLWVSLGHRENTDRLTRKYELTRKSSRGLTQNAATQKYTSFHSGNFLIQGLS